MVKLAEPQMKISSGMRNKPSLKPMPQREVKHHQKKRNDFDFFLKDKINLVNFKVYLHVLI